MGNFVVARSILATAYCASWPHAQLTLRHIAAGRFRGHTCKLGILCARARSGNGAAGGWEAFLVAGWLIHLRGAAKADLMARAGPRGRSLRGSDGRGGTVTDLLAKIVVVGAFLGRDRLGAL